MFRITEYASESLNLHSSLPTRTSYDWIKQGQMELMETLSHFKQKGHVMAFFQDTVPEKPKDFLSKFLDGHWIDRGVLRLE